MSNDSVNGNVKNWLLEVVYPRTMMPDFARGRCTAFGRSSSPTAPERSDTFTFRCICRT